MPQVVVSEHTMSPSMQSGNSSSDMYREILKEIGAEESTMDYLFDESSEEGGDTDEDSIPLAEPRYPSASQHLLPGGDAESDDELLHQWESEVEDNVDESNDEIKYTTPSLANGKSNSASEWKVKLQEATTQQEQLMSQMMKLQSVQKESSPSKQKQNAEKGLNRTPVAVQEESFMGSPVLQEISLRNSQLQEEWQSQQKQTVELQEKLNSLQTQFHNEQTQWKKESEQLFSPARSPTKIPRWEPTPAKSTSKVTFVDTPSSSFPPSTLKGSNEYVHNVDEIKKQQSNEGHVSLSALQEREDRIRELEAQLGEAKRLQNQQKEELDILTNRLKQRDAEYQALLFQYETDKKIWEDAKHEMEFRRKKEKEALTKDLEAANDLLQKQVTLNQEQREELHELKAKSWDTEIEDTQNQIKFAIAQQTEKTKEFQTRIKDLEDRHEEERQSWKSRLEGYKEQLEENAAGWESRLEEANSRYSELEARYLKETREWQELLEMDMTKTIEESGEAGEVSRSTDINESANKVGLLSPIPRESSIVEADNDSNSSDSSDPIKSAPSQSLEKIDKLMDEIGKMSDERNAILDEINRQDESAGDIIDITEPLLQGSFRRNETGGISGSTVEDCPQPVETPRSSPVNGQEAEQSNILDTTSDSVVLDRTLSLLNNLKDLMTCNGDMNEREASVLEHLEVLSELMQDESSYQSLLSSPRRGHAQPNETSLDLSRDDEHETTWMSGIQVSVDPWPALVSELTGRCEFLERDRRELARITEGIIKKERASHRVEIEAAVATANREANEKLHKQTQEFNRALRAVYQSLCYRCQQRVYSIL